MFIDKNIAFILMLMADDMNTLMKITLTDPR